MHVLVGLAAIAYAFVVIYGLNIRKAYPDVIMDWAMEPFARFIAYIAVYIASVYEPVAGLAVLIAVLLIHLDYLALGRQ